MTKKENSNNSIIPVGSTGLVRVGYSIDITNKIIKEHEERGINQLYPTVKIGNQIWMTKNIDVDYYANGDKIPEVQNLAEWKNIKTGAWCYYDNNYQNGLKYGKLYNWYAISDDRNICPNGFRVPSEKDWEELIEYLGGYDANVGFKLKVNGENLLRLHFGGYINSGEFECEGKIGGYWSLYKFKDGEDCKTWNYCVASNYNDLLPFDDGDNQGFYLRLIKDR